MKFEPIAILTAIQLAAFTIYEIGMVPRPWSTVIMALVIALSGFTGRQLVTPVAKVDIPKPPTLPLLAFALFLSGCSAADQRIERAAVEVACSGVELFVPAAGKFCASVEEMALALGAFGAADPKPMVPVSESDTETVVEVPGVKASDVAHDILRRRGNTP